MVQNLSGVKLCVVFVDQPVYWGPVCIPTECIQTVTLRKQLTLSDLIFGGFLHYTSCKMQLLFQMKL